jgi:PPM family protein phosphatase
VTPGEGPCPCPTCTRQSARHDVNQDRVTVGDEVLTVTTATERRQPDPPAVVTVLDGMGGAPAGDLAAELAARAIAAADLPATQQGVAEVLERADRLLLDAGQDDVRQTGMATTAALLALLDDYGHAVVANVGDSQVARLGPDGLHELSTSDRIGKSTIFQSLGGPPQQTITPHVVGLRLDVGDRLLLATDGLTDVVDLDTITRLLHDQQPDPAGRLLETVEQDGVPDDVTIVVVDVEAE